MTDMRREFEKTPLHLPLRYFPDALAEVAEVCRFGDLKHGSKWNKSHPQTTDYYVAKVLRHLSHVLQDPDVPDSESELLHLGHAAHNLLGLLQVRKDKASVNTITEE